MTGDITRLLRCQCTNLTDNATTTMLRAVFQSPFSYAGMVKLVDTMDSKSIGLAAVPVRLRLPVPLNDFTTSYKAR